MCDIAEKCTNRSIYQNRGQGQTWMYSESSQKKGRLHNTAERAVNNSAKETADQCTKERDHRLSLAPALSPSSGYTILPSFPQAGCRELLWACRCQETFCSHPLQLWAARPVPSPPYCEQSPTQARSHTWRLPLLKSLSKPCSILWNWRIHFPSGPTMPTYSLHSTPPNKGLFLGATCLSFLCTKL